MGPIMFSDEFHFQLFPDDHRGRVWRNLGKRADPAFTIATTQAFNQELLSGAPFLLTAEPLLSSLEHTYSTEREHGFAASKASGNYVVGDEIETSIANPQTLVVEKQHINTPEEP
ncbi:hypothetical protein TNCV_749731 [Trichonephila clavipes]|nr:hypothetical protein TNCV_749731 [Trichonephila clavipes]